MSVVLLGMEMPHDCPHCEFAAIGYASPMSSDCTLYCRAVDKFKDCATAVLKDKPYEVINHYNDRPDWCPLVPLPEKHGRLVDVDAVVDKLLSMQVMYQMLDDTRTADKIIHGIIRAKQTIYEAPTIVEAEGD